MERGGTGSAWVEYSCCGVFIHTEPWGVERVTRESMLPRLRYYRELDPKLPGKSNEEITTSCKSVIKETNKGPTENRVGGRFV